MIERQPARWTSKFGSVTFNQYGKDNPMGGVNERGLVIEVMELQWRQEGLPRVERLAPRATATSKILHLHLERDSAGTPSPRTMS